MSEKDWRAIAREYRDRAEEQRTVAFDLMALGETYDHPFAREAINDAAKTRISAAISYEALADQADMIAAKQLGPSILTIITSNGVRKSNGADQATLRSASAIQIPPEQIPPEQIGTD